MSKKLVISAFILFCISLHQFYNGSSLSPSQNFQKSYLFPDKEVVRKIIKDYFKKIFYLDENQIEVKEVKIYNFYFLSSHPTIYEVSLSSNSNRGGNVSATIFFYLTPDEVKRVRVTAKVELNMEVLIASRYLAKNQIIGEEDVKFVYKKLSQFPSDILLEKDEVIGKMTTIAINQGEILRKGMLKSPPLIRKGDQVTILIENSKLRITAIGEAKEEGGMGDKIRLVNLTSKKEVFGKILDQKTVKIDF
ncbi:MAG: flagellar basal body P-ring formation chaperone FlgA [Bacteroidales bacterium]